MAARADNKQPFKQHLFLDYWIDFDDTINIWLLDGLPK
jgi:hypothetical protein